MRAVQINQYGNNDVLEVNENAPSPTPQNGQLLVEVYASGVNPVDLAIRAGYLQQMAPLQFPATMGSDFAGVVEALGEGVTDFSVGDEVYGQAIILNGGSGSFAQELVTNSRNTALKPKTASFEEAGALPLAGVSAVQALEEHVSLGKNQKILIHGGAGGIGHIGIQLAKFLGAYVATTVVNKDVAFVKSLGADEVIDYQTKVFEDILKDFDAVFDLVGGQTLDKSFKVLKRGGIIVSMLGQPSPELAEKFGVRAIGQNTATNTQHLNRLAQLVDSGKVKVHVDKTFPLEKTKEACQYTEERHSQGKVVLRIKE